MFQRVIVPLDGSIFAETSLPCAEELAGRMGSQIILLTVLEPTMATFDNVLQCYLESRAEALRSRILERGGRDVSVESMLINEEPEPYLIGNELPGPAIGHPAADIIAAAAAQKASLILMASHSYSRAQQFGQSNIADTIIRRCGLPVLLVRPHRDPDNDRDICRNIVVPIDGSALAEKAVAVVEEMADKMVGQEMSVNLIHVVPDGHKATTPEPSPIFLAHIEHPAWYKGAGMDETYFSKVEEYLKFVGQDLVSRGAAVSYTVRSGKPEIEIVRLVGEEGAGMVVMSSHSRTGLARYVIGSVADRLLRTVDVSILLLRPDKSQLTKAE